jgi:hypothetical protein
MGQVRYSTTDARPSREGRWLATSASAGLLARRVRSNGVDIRACARTLSEGAWKITLKTRLQYRLLPEATPAAAICAKRFASKDRIFYDQILARCDPLPADEDLTLCSTGGDSQICLTEAAPDREPHNPITTARSGTVISLQSGELAPPRNYTST